MKKHLATLGAALVVASVSAPSFAKPKPQDAPAPALQPCSKVNNQQPCAADDAAKEEPKSDEPKKDEAKKDDAAKKDEPKTDEAQAGAGAAASGSGITLTGPTSGEPAKDKPQGEAKKEPSKKYTFRGTSLLFDQSITTQTAQLEAGSPQQSYIPFYEWWISFRPRFYITEKLYTWMRIDFFKEFTNSGETTYARENVFGDIWTSLTYKTPLDFSKNTTVTANLRLDIPTSKESQANGMITKLGVGGGISQKVPINGEDAKVFNSASFGLSVLYQHSFTTATTKTGYGTFARERQDTEGRSFTSDQISGSMLTNHTLLISASAGLHITPKLSFSPSMIWINNWKYTPTDATVQTAAGPTTVPRDGNATSFSQSTWWLATLDYDLFDEISLGLGYYNLANVIAPDGVRRGVFGSHNIFWSPDARVFFDVTFNIDAIYDFASGKKSEEKKAASMVPGARQARIQQMANP